ncbi:type II toxin-antitoxin system RelE/ParE family toxin [Parabacteroides sp. PF5-6]|uniref:type II toxin-antitoxin system RelE/ParE family toxin n=1 Tax=Parabacteroides sp. PF5-6 TaxID=1742403 RepID=UPI002405B68F|nr:type II toxin-antitoxin system RelE/ParE family toxin [Parabacteroides sp. PF5-6]MDF9831589.1 mRNA-degrading endonuclease RelE of RelBE toxin-antitoxin system [Parabacteroides sp. PF5-6]
MNYEIKSSRRFKKEIKRLTKKYRNIGKDYEALLDKLEQNPAIGIDLGGGVRKIRMPISDKGKGKSHGARVITYTVIINEENGVITLLTIYDKAEQVTITPQEIARLLKNIERLK